MSPLAAWARSDNPLRVAPDERLRPGLLLEPRKHKVNYRKGICFKGQFWMSAPLIDIVGRSVQIRYPVGFDLEFIDVYLDGKWHCSAEPADRLSDAQKKAVWDRRDDMYHEARELHTQATALREGANADLEEDRPTPAVAAMGTADPFPPNADDFYDYYHAPQEDPS